MASGFSPLALRAFELAFVPWMRGRVGSVRVAGLPDGLPEGEPILLAANHVSWWDGFVLREIHRRLRPGAPLYTVMLASELERRPFFRRLGGVGIDPGSPASVARALRGLRARLRERPDGVVAFFPQGTIWPSFRRPLGFRRGVEGFVRGLAPLTVLPVGIHLEPLNAVRPTVFASVGAPLRSAGDAPSVGELEGCVAAQLDAILAFLAEHGEAAPRRWPPAHLSLPSPAGRAPGRKGEG